MLTQGQMCGDQNLINFPTCHFSVEDSRLSNPPCTLRGTGWNRFQPLCLDPQDQVLFPGDYQVPTRLVVKDNHRPCVPTPAVNNMLPQQRRLPCLKTDSTCASYTSPSYQYDVCGPGSHAQTMFVIVCSRPHPTSILGHLMRCCHRYLRSSVAHAGVTFWRWSSLC